MKRTAIEIGIYLVIATVALCGLLMVGTMDYEDAVAEADYYTRMVCDGYWSDYDNRQPECGE